MTTDLLGEPEMSVTEPKPKRTRVARPQPEETPGPRLAGGEAAAVATAAAPPQIWEPQTAPSSMLAKIAELAANPDVDVEKTKALHDMYLQLRGEEARREYAAAMNAAQAEIEPVARATQNTVTNSWYAKLEAVDAAIRPIYTAHGFSLSDNTIPPIVPGNIRIECVCAHVGGHFERFGREAAPDTMGPKGTPTKTLLHGGGSTETFLKRYLRCGIFNVVFKNLDDDGTGGICGDKQIAHLRGLLAVLSNLDPARDQESRLCGFLKVDSLDDLPLAKYGDAAATLTGELKKLTKAKTEPAKAD